MSSLDALVHAKRDELEALCRRFGARRLELFGSATGDQFNPTTSDLDFLVEFEPSAAGGPADRYFGLLEALQTLYGRPVDLVDLSAIRNPYFLEAIEKSRIVLHAA